MAKGKKKSAKKASDIFHKIMKESVSPPPKAITPPEKHSKNTAKKNDK